MQLLAGPPVFCPVDLEGPQSKHSTGISDTAEENTTLNVISSQKMRFYAAEEALLNSGRAVFSLAIIALEIETAIVQGLCAGSNHLSKTQP